MGDAHLISDMRVDTKYEFEINGKVHWCPFTEILFTPIHPLALAHETQTILDTTYANAETKTQKELTVPWPKRVALIRQGMLTR